MFDEIAKQIGWLVIGAGIFYVVGKAVISHGDAEGRKKELILSTWDHQRRLAFRKIWHSTQDALVIEQVKMAYGPWSLLDIELDDEQYDSKMRQSNERQAYIAASERIKLDGFPYVLEGGGIIATFTNEYKSRPQHKKMQESEPHIDTPTQNTTKKPKFPSNEVVSDVCVDKDGGNHPLFQSPLGQEVNQHYQQAVDEYIQQEIERISLWLEREMTPSEIEESGYAEMASSPDEKFWLYRSPPESWEVLAGQAGIALIKDGKIVRYFETIVS